MAIPDEGSITAPTELACTAAAWDGLTERSAILLRCACCTGSGTIASIMNVNRAMKH